MPGLSFIIQCLNLDDYFNIDFSTSLFPWLGVGQLSPQRDISLRLQGYTIEKGIKDMKERGGSVQALGTYVAAGPWGFRSCLFSGGRLSTIPSAWWTHLASFTCSTQDSSVQLCGWTVMPHKNHTIQRCSKVVPTDHSGDRVAEGSGGELRVFT